MSAQADLFAVESLQKRPNGIKACKTKLRRTLMSAVASPREAQFLTIDEVMKRYAVSHATIWRWVKSNEDFPEPVKLSLGTSRWLESQLIEFERRAQSRQDSKRSKANKKVSP
jgi:predicted DNA-binding transcriptional regulator AlpA